MTTSSTNTTPMKPITGTQRPIGEFVILGGLFVLTAVGLVGLAVATGWQETVDAISRLSVTGFLLLLALSLVNYGFRGLRWHLFGRALGLPTTVAQDMRHFVGGFAMSVTPGRVGELVRMRWIRRETGWPFERTAPLVLVDRAADLVAMAVLMAAALAISAAPVGGAIPVIALALLVAVLATRPEMLRGFATLTYRATGWFPRLFARIRAASKSLTAFQSPSVLAGATLLGIVGWAAEGYAFYLLLDWLGADVSVSFAIAVFLFSTLAGGLTGAPGGVGGAEATMIGLLMIEHIPLEISIPATLIIRVTTLWFAVLLGLIVFPFAERHSLRTRDAT